MAIDSLTSTVRALITWTASDTLTGSDYGPTSNNTTITKSVSLGTSAANNVANGSDELISYIASISASSSTTLDLTSISNIIGATASLARVKAIMFRLLSTTDDSTNGTACSSVTIGNAASNANQLFLDNDADTFTLKNGEMLVWASPQAAGLTVDGTNKNVKILNNDGAVTAKVQVTIIGGST